jgi:hypothetical protein
MSDNCNDCQNYAALVREIGDKFADNKDAHTNLFDRVNTLEVSDGKLQTDMNRLIKSMDDLVSTIKWGIGMFTTIAIFTIGSVMSQIK